MELQFQFQSPREEAGKSEAKCQGPSLDQESDSDPSHADQVDPPGRAQRRWKFHGPQVVKAHGHCSSELSTNYSFQPDQLLVIPAPAQGLGMAEFDGEGCCELQPFWAGRGRG